MTEQAVRNQDAELASLITNRLTILPDELHNAELQLLNLELDLRNARADLKDAELDAQVNCDTSQIKNAEARKVAMDKSVSENSAVQAARTHTVELEAMKIGADARFNDLLRRYSGALALCGFQTAKINYRTAFQPRTK